MNTDEAISELLFTSVSKRVLVHNLLYGNEFDLQDKKCARKISILHNLRFRNVVYMTIQIKRVLSLAIFSLAFFILANYYFQVSSNLKGILYVAKIIKIP